MLIRINGRLRFFGRLDKVTKVRTGIYEVERNGITYHVEGGRTRGGTAREWFVHAPGWERSILTTGLVDSLNLIDGA